MVRPLAKGLARRRLLLGLPTLPALATLPGLAGLASLAGPLHAFAPPPAPKALDLLAGNHLGHFRTPTQTTPPDDSWLLANGELRSRTAARRQCDLWTLQPFESFLFSFEWLVEPGANTGIKYLLQAQATDQLRDAHGPLLHETSLGFEFQLVDRASPASTDHPTHQSGALYNYLPPARDASLPAGQWNSGQLRLQGDAVEHWVNGEKVLAYTFSDPALRTALAAKKLNSARLLEKLAHRRTPIALQHHESAVAFRNLRLTGLA